MVDFQQRDTRRGLDDDESDDEDDSSAPDTASETESTQEHSDTENADDSHGNDHAQQDHDHDHHTHDVDKLGVAIVTISSTRTRENDPSGDVIQSTIETAGHNVVIRDSIRDKYDGIQNAADKLVGRSDVDIVVTTGGTGVTPDDVTIEAIEPLFEKELPGFGELFRQLSYDEIGTKVVGTRATAGIADGVPIFCLPGSENAARLGVEEIIATEAPHLAGLATRDADK